MFDENTSVDSDAVPFELIDNGYCESKWIAEKLISDANKGGLASFIYRLDFVTGSAMTGASNSHDLFNLFLLGCIEMKCMPDWEVFPLFLNPVELVCKSLVTIALHTHAKPESIYHVFAKNEFRLQDLRPLFVKHFGVEVAVISEQAWMDRLSALPEISHLFRISSSWLTLKDTTVPPVDVQISSQLTCAFLRSHNIEMNLSPHTVLDTYFSFLKSQQSELA